MGIDKKSPRASSYEAALDTVVSVVVVKKIGTFAGAGAGEVDAASGVAAAGAAGAAACVSPYVPAPLNASSIVGICPSCNPDKKPASSRTRTSCFTIEGLPFPTPLNRRRCHMVYRILMS